MDPETKQLLKDNLDIAKTNNIMLSKLVKAQKRANTYRLVYWGLILFFSFGAYYFIQPFLGNLLNVYGVSGVNNYSDVVKNLNDNKQQVKDLLNTMK